MMDNDPECPEKKPKQNWVSDPSFFRDALKMVNMMAQAKRENPERFKFLIWVDYMQEENNKSLEIIGRGPKVLSPWEDGLPPVMEHIDVEHGKIVIPQSSLLETCITCWNVFNEIRRRRRVTAGQMIYEVSSLYLF